MKRGIILVLIILTIIAVLSGCAQESTTSKEPKTDIDIYYSFGKNILDTKNNLYVKDMICDNQKKQYQLQLTDSEKMSIYNSVLENNFFNIKDEFTENCDSEGYCRFSHPRSTSTLKITADGKTKTIKWNNDYIIGEDPELKQFKNVENIIIDIIAKKEKDMNIEQPKCGYL